MPARSWANSTRARAPKPSPAPSGSAGSWCDAGARTPPASPQRLLVRAARTAVRLIAVTASSNQRAIDIDVVEHRQSKVVRSSVLSFIENDRDALYRDGGNGLKRVAIEERLQRCTGAAPAKPDEADPSPLRCWRWRAAAKEEEFAVLQRDI